MRAKKKNKSVKYSIKGQTIRTVINSYHSNDRKTKQDAFYEVRLVSKNIKMIYENIITKTVWNSGGS